MSKTRQSSTRLFDLTSIEQISWVSLPTNEEVLRRFLSIINDSESNNLKKMKFQNKSIINCKACTIKFLLPWKQKTLVLWKFLISMKNGKI